MSRRSKSFQFPCLPVALGYFSLSSLWTFFSNDIFAVILSRPDFKGEAVGPSHWFFIALTTGMLYWLLRYWEGAIRASQESLRKVNRSLKSYSECTKALTRTDNEQQLMKEICRICVEVGGHRMAWVALKEGDTDIHPAAHWGDVEAFFDQLQSLRSSKEIIHGPAGTSISTGKIIFFQNLLVELPYQHWRELLIRCGFLSCIALPLVDDGKTFGALVIYDQKKNAFDEAEVALLEELAGDLAYGIMALQTKAARLKEMQERLMLAKVMDQASDGIITISEKGMIQYINPSFVDLCGVPADECIGVSIHDFECSKRNPKFYQAILSVFQSNKMHSGHFINKKRDGREYDIDARIAPVFDETGKAVRYVVTIRDVTHEIGLERQLRQAQKMEALATLSGGIAHDFNNILAIILSNAEMTLEDLETDDPRQRSLALVHKAGLRGKNLVKQFLTFSRQNEQPKKPVKIAEVVLECTNMLRPMLPSTIEIREEIDESSSYIAADPTQIHQVLMNLCTNAGDAMREKGGVLDLRISSVVLAERDVRRLHGLKEGRYVKLVVADTGHGMSRDIQDRIFDPFYTTKSQGRGTGLGLSTAHGIIKNHGGLITVTSIVDLGTTFVIYLPQIDRSETRPQEIKVREEEKIPGRILFVDDEADYCTGMKISLQRLGYQVVVETNSLDTLKRFKSDPKAFDILITDQTMPNLTGSELARKILEIRPDLPVILCSGASAEVDTAADETEARKTGIERILHKPVERAEIDQVVQNLLKNRNQRATAANTG